jgi:hypothetical protein
MTIIVTPGTGYTRPHETNPSVSLDFSPHTTYSYLEEKTAFILNKPLPAYAFYVLARLDTGDDNSAPVGNFQSGPNTFMIRTSGSGGTIECDRKGADESQQTSTISSAFSIGDWTRVIGRWDGATISMICDGTQGPETVSTSTHVARDVKLRFGRINASQDRWRGLMADAAIWTGRIPSDAELLSISRGHKDPRDALPNHYYRFDRGAGTEVYDEVGSSTLEKRTEGNTPWNRGDVVPIPSEWTAQHRRAYFMPEAGGGPTPHPAGPFGHPLSGALGGPI